MTDILDELRWRGLLALSTDQEALRSALASGPVTYYCGFDPTAPSLHMGNLVQLLTMRRLQDAGHHPLALVGGSTGLIGDPKPTAERVLNSKDTVAEWVERERAQVERYLSFEGPNAAVVVNNLDWTAPMSALDFLRDVGKHYRVNTMIKKDAVADRLASQDGISYTEFSYQILQGLDFLELYRRYGCVLQTGGSDQWGNLTSGVDLIHRAEGVSVHALATPLVTKADGTKYGKTEAGTVWLDPEMTTPYAFFQFWLNAEDAIVGSLLRIFTFRSREEIEALEASAQERPQLREAQRGLARDVTTLVHGAEAARRVEAASRALFGREATELHSLDAVTLRDATAELPQARGTVGDRVVDLMADSRLVAGRNAARRAVAEGGAYLNNVKVTDPDALLTSADVLPGGVALLRRGRRSLAAVSVRPT
ncbi:MAG: tyrosine--tRNA ligase [Actinomycetales bacterium]